MMLKPVTKIYVMGGWFIYSEASTGYFLKSVFASFSVCLALDLASQNRQREGLEVGEVHSTVTTVKSSLKKKNKKRKINVFLGHRHNCGTDNTDIISKVSECFLQETRLPSDNWFMF